MSISNMEIFHLHSRTLLEFHPVSLDLYVFTLCTVLNYQKSSYLIVSNQSILSIDSLLHYSHYSSSIFSKQNHHPSQSFPFCIQYIHHPKYQNLLIVWLSNNLLSPIIYLFSISSY